MSEQECTGHVRAMRADADWFGAEDFLDLADTPLQIVKVCYDPELSIGGSRSKDKYYLRLADKNGRESKKRMSINSHRRKMLGLMYGGKVENWKGKWVHVTTAEVKSPQGGKTIGMRFTNDKSAPQGSVGPSTQNPAGSDLIGDQFERENPT